MRELPGEDEVGDQHGREAAEADGEQNCAVVVRRACLIAEEAGELDHLAQDERVVGDECEHDGEQVLRAAGKAQQERSHHHHQLRSTQAACQHTLTVHHINQSRSPHPKALMCLIWQGADCHHKQIGQPV